MADSSSDHVGHGLGDVAWVTTHPLYETAPWPLEIHRDTWYLLFDPLPPRVSGPTPSILGDLTSACLLQNLQWLQHSDTKFPKFICCSTQAWPPCPLDNQSKSPPNSFGILTLLRIFTNFMSTQENGKRSFMSLFFAFSAPNPPSKLPAHHPKASLLSSPLPLPDSSAPKTETLSVT